MKWHRQLKIHLRHFLFVWIIIIYAKKAQCENPMQSNDVVNCSRISLADSTIVKRNIIVDRRNKQFLFSSLVKLLPTYKMFRQFATAGHRKDGNYFLVQIYDIRCDLSLPRSHLSSKQLYFQQKMSFFCNVPLGMG